MGAVLASPPTDEVGAKMFAATLAPRSSYRRWLEAELASLAGDSTELPTTSFRAADLVFSWLITTIEQTMAHAFVQWHQGRRDMADISWASSGLAMVQATSLVNALADLNTVPASMDVRTLAVTLDSDAAIRQDARLAHELAEVAAESMQQETDPSLKAICEQVTCHARALAAWRPPKPHPALASCAPSFRSFEATLQRFVWR
jgi:hypothetical protein